MPAFLGPKRYMAGRRCAENGSVSPVCQRILILVPHDPIDDPRVAWVTTLAAAVAPTVVLAACRELKGPAVEWEGNVYRERFLLSNYVESNRRLALLAGMRYKKCVRFYEREQQRAAACGASPSPWAGKSLWRGGWLWNKYHLGGVLRGWGTMAALRLFLAEPIWRRARYVPAPPALVICEDFATLLAGIRLKQRFGCPVIYDAHEFTPEADMFSHPWERRRWARWERSLARQADALVTVTPQLAQEFQERYQLPRVLSVPNAAPLITTALPPRRPPSYPLRFLLQGGAAPGRGFEVLLNSWRELNDPRAHLLIRCPANDYLQQLQQRYADLVARGLVHFLPAVHSDDLISAAACADIGIIPYPIRIAGHINRNHLYCCPNKLSQYMQAGLAILSTASHFVREQVNRYRCGDTYDPDVPSSLLRVVRLFLDDLSRVQAMQAAARQAVLEEFHWEYQSRPLRDLIACLYHRAASANHSVTG
jgi:glycosyltransferase involved in cell wall biosynthesis